MLMACALAAAALTLPPMTMSVRAAPGISASVIRATLAEASALFRESRLDIAWDLVESASGLRVVIDEAGGALNDGDMALGWILFAAGVPAPDIHLSFRNAMSLLEEAESTGTVHRMTRLERDTLIGRALGRALAHELGHYLLATKAHTKDGLMRMRMTATEFFSPSRARFDLTAAQQAAIASRLLHVETVARQLIPNP